MTTLRHIERTHAALCRSIFMTTGRLSYDRITQGMIRLCELINDYCSANDDTESLWYIGEHTGAPLADFLPGAYWHYCQWHAGQARVSYQALCALGSIFSPGMSSPEDDGPEADTINALNDIAEKDQRP